MGAAATREVNLETDQNYAPQGGTEGEIVRFVRDRLGCQCPPEVFRSISVAPAPGLEALAPGCCLISVGGRLLVLVWPDPGVQPVAAALPELVTQGRRLRDAAGFNRLRVVIASSEPSNEQRRLAPLFTEAAGGDPRLHLHVIDAADLPSLGSAT